MIERMVLITGITMLAALAAVSAIFAPLTAHLYRTRG